jgi:hypothetical protein
MRTRAAMSIRTKSRPAGRRAPSGGPRCRR